MNEIVAFIDTWQNGLASLATLVAAVIAFLAVQKQIHAEAESTRASIEADRANVEAQMAAEKRMISLSRDRKKAAFLLVLSSALEDYLRRLATAESDSESAINLLNSGVGLDMKKVFRHIQEMLFFDQGMINSWEVYSEFDLETIKAIRDFYDCISDQSAKLHSLGIVISSDVPLLRVARIEDRLVDEAVSKLGALSAAVSDTKIAVNELLQAARELEGGTSNAS